MALLSIEMIRDLQGIANTYAERERERVASANAAALDRQRQATGQQQAGGRRQPTRVHDRADA